MPDQFGNPTPQEVMAQIAGEDQALLTQGATPQERRLNRLVHATRLMAGGQDPRLAQADQIVKAQRRALSMQQEEGESNLDFSIRQGRTMLEDMRDVDPATYAQISEQLTGLEKERLDRRLLLARDERAAAQDERAAAQSEQQVRSQTLANDRTQRDLDFNNVVYFYDPQEQALTGEVMDSTEEGFAERLSAFQQTNPGVIPVSREQVLDVLDTSAADINYFNNSTREQKIGAINNQLRFVDNAAALASVFARSFEEEAGNPAAQVIGSINRGIGSIMNNLTEGRRILDNNRDRNEVVLPSYGSAKFEEDVKDIEGRMREDSDMLRWVNQNNISFQDASTLMTSLAYTLARTYDNRVTDADFRNAWKMLGGGNSDPGTIMSALRQQALHQSRSLTDEIGTEVNNILELYPSGSEAVLDATVISRQLALLKARSSEFQSASQSIMDRYGQRDTYTPADHVSPAASAATPLTNGVVTGADGTQFIIR